MKDVLYTLFSRYCGGLNAKGKPQLGNFAVLAKNTRTGNWSFARHPGAPQWWLERHEADDSFIFDPRNDSLFQSDPLKVGDVVVERDLDLKEHWPECWWHSYLEEHEDVKAHLS